MISSAYLKYFSLHELLDGLQVAKLWSYVLVELAYLILLIFTHFQTCKEEFSSLVVKSEKDGLVLEEFHVLHHTIIGDVLKPRRDLEAGWLQVLGWGSQAENFVLTCRQNQESIRDA